MFALADGYDRNARRLSAREREQIWQGDQGSCILCGAAGAEIDHIDGSSRDPNNLRVLRGPCNLRLAWSHGVPLATLAAEQRQLVAHRLAELTRRIQAPEPLRPCDDDIAWRNSWQQ